MNKHLTSEQSFAEIAAHAAVIPETASQTDKPVIMLKRIGSTTYQVAVHFSKTSSENMNDKIVRLIKNEVAGGKAEGQ